MLQKESKIRILENFKSLDYVFFGKPVTEMVSCCPALVEEYMTSKGAMMSLMIEMLQLLEHSPSKLDEYVDKNSLTENAINSAVIARQNAEDLVQTEQGRADIKAELKEALLEDETINLDEEVKDRIRQKAFGLAIDNLLVARAVTESNNHENLNEWEGEIIEDAYKVLRDALVENALFILESNDITV